MKSRRRFFAIVSACACAMAASCPSASRAAFTLMYSDTTTFSSSGYAGGGATTIGSNTITTMVADDITAGAGLGGHTVDQFSFSVANFNSVAVSARAIVQFYQGNGAGGGPGTLITSLTFNPINFAAGVVSVFTYTPGSPLFTMPTGLFWAGISFDNNNGATGATVAQMNGLGQGLYNPPTVGTSQDAFFKSTSATSTGANNPAGGFLFFGGNPVANFGWNFSTAQAVPEPSSIVLCGVAGIAFLGRRLVRRRGVRVG